MQEFFYTVLAIWVIWKLFSVFSSSSSKKETSQQYYQANHHHHYNQRKQEGDVTIQQTKSDRKSKSDPETEYTDYEEIK